GPLLERHRRAVTLLTAIGSDDGALDHLSEHVVERADEPCRHGVMRALELRDDVAVTARAVFRTDDGRDQFALVHEGILVAGLGPMAVVAADADLGVLAVAPLRGDDWGLLRVTCDAFVGVGADCRWGDAV